MGAALGPADAGAVGDGVTDGGVAVGRVTTLIDSPELLGSSDAEPPPPPPQPAALIAPARR